MSFNKRILCKENIVANISNIEQYLGNPDAIITTDEFSDKVYKMFSEDVSIDEIIDYIEKNK